LIVGLIDSTLYYEPSRDCMKHKVASIVFLLTAISVALGAFGHAGD
jgi:hypothetical protein